MSDTKKVSVAVKGYGVISKRVAAAVVSQPDMTQPEGDFVLGKSQKMTARNAGASTFGLRGENYAPEQET